MTLFDRLAERVETHARGAADQTLRVVEAALAEFPDVTVRREGDELIISGRGLVRRWLTDARLRFALWRQG